MSDNTRDDANADISTDGVKEGQTDAVTSTYKVLGQLTADDGVGVLGQNDAGSGTPIGVEGAVPNSSDGYGISTPDDARVGNDLDVGNFVHTSNFELTGQFNANPDLQVYVDDTRNMVIDGQTANDEAGNIIFGAVPNYNDTTADYGATISGGGIGASTSEPNLVYDNFGTIGGGKDNTAGTSDGDPTSAEFATVSGGESNEASGLNSTVSGGLSNTALRKGATVGGGRGNQANHYDTTIAGGKDNVAGLAGATVGGGEQNSASGNATVGGGFNNDASGSQAVIPGGQDNIADGNWSFAAGFEANTNGNDVSFVWAGKTAGNPAAAQAANQVVFGQTNGFYVGDDGGPSGDFYGNDNKLIDTSTGAHLTTGGAWTDNSSRTVKEDIEPVDSLEMLTKVGRLTISEWTYEADPEGSRHCGPMAEEFNAVFGLGGDGEHIAPLDTAGVALACIKGLSKELEEKDERIEKVEAENQELRNRLERLEDRLGSLESGDPSPVTADD